MTETDPFKILGVERTATEDEAHKAFRARAKECHPDLRDDKEAATREFQLLDASYQEVVRQIEAGIAAPPTMPHSQPPRDDPIPPYYRKKPEEPLRPVKPNGPVRVYDYAHDSYFRNFDFKFGEYKSGTGDPDLDGLYVTISKDQIFEDTNKYGRTGAIKFRLEVPKKLAETGGRAILDIDLTGTTLPSMTIRIIMGIPVDAKDGETTSSVWMLRNLVATIKVV